VNKIRLIATAAWLILLASTGALATNNATFVSQSVPSIMAPGATYPVTVTMHNSGDTAWTAASLYRLGSQNPQDGSTWGMGRVELPNDVSPGQDVTIAFTVTAPANVGTYNFQWRMVQDGIEWFGDYTTNVAVKDGDNEATMASQNVPSVMAPGQVYPVSVTMQNTGNTTWTQGALYRLGAQDPQDNTTWGTNRVELPNAVAPGQSVTFNFNVTAPTTVGTYHFQWRMVQDTVAWFGDYSADVAVKDGDNEATFVSQTVPSAMIPGQSYAVSVTMLNAGNTTWKAANQYRLGSQNPQDNNTWGFGRVELPNDVAPGASVTFNFNVVAPTALGTYDFQWRMVEDNVEWFGDSSTDVAVRNGLNDSAFVSQTVPTSMTPGQSYPVTVTMKNTGNVVWKMGAGYRLGSQNPQDNGTWGLGRVELPNDVAPGAQVTFSFSVVAPSSMGTYNFQWRMVDELIEWFGAYSDNVSIQDGMNNAAFVSQTVPTQMTVGQSYPVSVTVKNTGTSTWTSANLYRLGSQNPQDNNTWGLGRVELPASVAPGATTTFNFNVVAPPAAGNYNFQWRMVEDSVQWFGSYSTNVVVAASQGSGPPAPSNVVTYSYDLAGNIIGIARKSTANVLAITSVSPGSGNVGTPVTIYGSGFNSIPANNTVAFNGVAATVTAAASGSIATTVPAGATTGRVTVATGGSNATSPTNFVVTVPGAPTIASFTPNNGLAGTLVQVAGTNFDPAAGATTVTLNGVSVSATVTSATGLSFTVPSSVGSGRIAITTSTGTGSSSADFLVAPPYSYGNAVLSELRITPDTGNTLFNMNSAGTTVLVLFDATAGGFYTMHFSNLQTSPTVAAVPYAVIGPDNTQISTGTLTISGVMSIHLPPATRTGTYAISLAPTNNATLSTRIRVQTDPAITPDGAAMTLTDDYPRQSSRFIFNATAGQRFGAEALGIVLVPTNSGSFGVSFNTPDGTELASQICNPGNCHVSYLMPTTGTYWVGVGAGPPLYATGSVQLSSAVTGTLTADAPQTVNLTRAGQDASYTFTANAGDSYGIDISSVSMTPANSGLTVTVLRPNGTPSTNFSANFGGFYDLGMLPATGTYTVVVVPDKGATGTFRITAKQGPLMQFTDSPVAFSTTGASESARFRFNATAGQGVSVAISGFSYTTGGGTANLQIYAPDGTAVGFTGSCGNSFGAICHASLKNTVAGTYSAVLQPPYGTMISGNALASAALTGTISAGTPLSLGSTRLGQGAVLTFSGTAGDNTSLKALGVAVTPSGQALTVNVWRPDGGFYNAMGPPNSNFMNIPSLPQTGTYTVVVDPSGSTTAWSGAFELDPGTLIAVDGPTVTLPTLSPGEPIRFRVNGTAGQRVDFGLSGLSYSAANNNGTGFNVYDPNNNNPYGMSCGTSSPGCDFEASSLVYTATYAVVFTPPPGVAITGGTFAISTPQAGTFNVGDPAQVIALSRPGQTARYTFSGTSGQTLRLNWTSASVQGGASVAVTVLNPSGGTVANGSFFDGGSGGVDLPALTATGTYTIVLDPSLAQSMSASVSLVTR
jgi:alkylated DNA repair dioxygenase AlkB